jgi:hypothetical protein
MRIADLYDHDFLEWTVRNAQLLRSGRVQEADIAHIAEEIEDMGKSQRRALESRLEVLLAHLLKWQFQPEGRSPSWRATIRLQRSRIHKLLREMPSLRAVLPKQLPDAYENASLAAVGETGLPDETFPKLCPYSLEQILDDGYFPA